MSSKADTSPAFARTCQLGELLDFRNEIVHPKDKPTGSSIFVGLEHIERDTGVRIGAERVDLSNLTGRRARFHAGDIVYGYLRPYLNKVWIAEFDGICSVDQYVFVGRPSVDRDYVARFLRSDQFLKTAPINSTPGQLPRIRSGEVAATPIVLPPLAEQRRIAAILDNADALRRKRKRALELLDTLARLIFLDIFGDPVSNPKKLQKIALGDLIKVKSGNGLVAKDMAIDGKYPVYGGNGINGFHNAFMFEEPRIVIGRVGVYCGAIHITQPNSWVTDNALYVSEVKRKSLITYLAAALTEANLNQYAGRAAQPLISGSRIYPVEILLPEIAEQNRFGSAMQQLSDVRRRYSLGLESTGLLFSSLQHRAFSGQL